jgi:hypothetical protein
MTALGSDAAGNSFAVWKLNDNRLFINKLDPSGVLQWGASGVLLSDAANNFSVVKMVIVPDEAGGCYAVWEDFRAGTPTGPTDVYAQHIPSAGTPAWAANGIAIASGPAKQFEVAACSDGAGGVIVSWSENRNGTDFDVYAQRVDGNGAFLWNAGGVQIHANALSSTVVADGSGGAFIMWADYGDGEADVYAQRINASGAFQWGTNGVAVSTTPNAELPGRLALDGTGGVFAVWNSAGDFVQHLDGAGGPLWGSGVRPVASATGGAGDVGPDGVGGCYVGGSGVLMRVFPSGKPAWARDYQAVASAGYVLGDEGGWVQVGFDRPAPDGGVGYSPSVTGYSVWRKRSGSSAGAGARLADPGHILAGLTSEPSVGSHLTGYTDFPPGTWDVVTYTPALRLPRYALLVPTHTDSTSAGAADDDFVVISHTSTSTRVRGLVRRDGPFGRQPGSGSASERDRRTHRPYERVDRLVAGPGERPLALRGLQGHLAFVHAFGGEPDRPADLAVVPGQRLPAWSLPLQDFRDRSPRERVGLRAVDAFADRERSAGNHPAAHLRGPGPAQPVPDRRSARVRDYPHERRLDSHLRPSRPARAAPGR